MASEIGRCCIGGAYYDSGKRIDVYARGVITERHPDGTYRTVWRGRAWPDVDALVKQLIASGREWINVGMTTAKWVK